MTLELKYYNTLYDLSWNQNYNKVKNRKIKNSILPKTQKKVIKKDIVLKRVSEYST